MGGQQSRPAPPPPPPPRPSPPPPLPDPATQCRLHKVELNQLQSDLKAKQTQVDTCDPQSAQRAKTQAVLTQNTAFITEQTKRLNTAVREVEESIRINTDIKVAVEPLLEIQDEIEKQKKELTEEKRKLSQEQRVQRRNFMDRDPQGSLHGIPGIYTSDDRVMLGFWLTFIPALILAYITLLFLFEVQWSLQGKISTGIVTLGTIIGLVYWLITQYA